MITPGSIISGLLVDNSPGKLTYTISAHTQQLLINMSALTGYVAGITNLTVVVNSGKYVWSDDMSVAALTISGGTSGDTITLVNNGFIMGKGGGYLADATTISAGGPAVSISRPMQVTNNGYIGGGGGAAGPGGAGVLGVGGAGGAGGGAVLVSNGTEYVAGGGGAIGAAGSAGGGGRGMPGAGASSKSFVAKGSADATSNTGGGSGAGFGGDGSKFKASSYGGGGGYGAAGGTSWLSSSFSAAGSTGAGGSGGGVGGNGVIASAVTSYPGTAGGKAINTNGNTVTYVVTGNVYGIVG